MRPANESQTEFYLRELPKLHVTTEAFWEESFDIMELLKSQMSWHCMFGFSMLILLPDNVI